MSGAPCKRKVLSLDVKAKIITEVMSGEKKVAVAEWYGMSLSSLSTILTLKDSIMSAVSAGGSGQQRKKVKEAVYVNVEKALFSWFLDMYAKNMALSGGILQQKALCLYSWARLQSQQRVAAMIQGMA